MKKELLELLKKNQSDACSGEYLSQQLGISRVSVWKHIKKLQELGYQIESGPKGYHFLGSDDPLYPWEFSSREKTVHYFEEVGSTMATAKEIARKGCPNFSIVLANRQKKGRGRLNRQWDSKDGGLYFTLILKPDIHPSMISRYSFAASLCLAQTLRERYQVNAQVKWPNDLLVDEKKISGMLCEMEMESDRISFLNIGIGLNVNNDPRKAEPNAVSLKMLKGTEISRKKLLEDFLDRFENELSKPDLDHIIPDWKQFTVTLNRKVKIVTTIDEVEGIAIDVDENGALLLQMADNSTRTIFYGDCFHQS